MEGPILPGPVYRAPILYWVLANSQGVTQISSFIHAAVVLRYLVCGTTHGWTASHQLTTSLADADDIFPRQAIDVSVHYYAHWPIK